MTDQRRNPATELDDGMRGWIKSYARKNFWRVASWYDYEDLVQDGMMCYASCVQRYEHRVKSKAHFMALLKQTFWTHVTDLSVRRTRLHEVPASDLGGSDEGSMFEQLLGGRDDEISFATLIREAPAEVGAVLRIILTDAGLATLRLSYRKQDGTRTTLNERLCKMVKLDPRKVDLSDRVRMYLKTA